MGDAGPTSSVAADTTRLLIVGAVAAGAAVAASSLYWNYHFSNYLRSAKARAAAKSGKARRKFNSANATASGSSSSSATVASAAAATASAVAAAAAQFAAAAAFDTAFDAGTMSTASTTPGGGGGPEVYENKRVVDEYVQFHFGKPEDILPYKDGPHSALRFTAGPPYTRRRICLQLTFSSTREYFWVTKWDDFSGFWDMRTNGLRIIFFKFSFLLKSLN